MLHSLLRDFSHVLQMHVSVDSRVSNVPDQHGSRVSKHKLCQQQFSQEHHYFFFFNGNLRKDALYVVPRFTN